MYTSRRIQVYFNNLASSLPSPFSYRVEMAIADDTAAGTFVWFDGVMKKLHNLRASEAVQMLVKYTSVYLRFYRLLNKSLICIWFPVN